jgi:hypothetical protein
MGEAAKDPSVCRLRLLHCATLSGVNDRPWKRSVQSKRGTVDCESVSAENMKC